MLLTTDNLEMEVRPGTTADARVLFEDQSGVAGYALYKNEAEWVYLRQFFVRPERRRQGLGRAAMKWLLENAWRESPRIRLDVLVGNEIGVKFWRSVGFGDYCLTMEHAVTPQKAHDMNSNPWNKVSLADYEAHMALPAVGQAAMLAREFRCAVQHARPNSLALVGCAGGNGLDELADHALERVVCVDVNPDYLEALRVRYEAKIRNLECHCCELEQFRSAEPVDLVFGGLVFEYTRLDEALDSVSRLLRDGGSLYALVQMPAEGMATVTPSPYAKALGVVEDAFKHVDPGTLIELAAERNLAMVERRVIQVQSGKSFTLVQFRKIRRSCSPPHDITTGLVPS